MCTYVNPPAVCDLCGGAISDEFSDARLPAYGQWANVCSPCATDQGVSYGTGKGQRYERQPDDSFVKVEG